MMLLCSPRLEVAKNNFHQRMEKGRDVFETQFRRKYGVIRDY